MKTKKHILKTLIKLQESAANEASDSSSQGKTPLEKRQAGTNWSTSPGHWGAKNPAGNIKYFDSEEAAKRYAEGLDDGPSGSSTETQPKQTQATTQQGADTQQQKAAPVKVVSPQSSQTKYVNSFGGFTAKDKTLNFSKDDEVEEYKIGGIPFEYDSINPELETDYDYNALNLPNGKNIAIFPLLETEGERSIEDDPEPKSKDELQGKRYSAGVIIEEDDGRIWILKPAGGFGGYEYTFPKGGLNADVMGEWDEYDTYTKNMELRTAAIREAFEETGLVVQIADYLGDIERSTTHNRYFIAKRVGGSPTNFDEETEQVTLIHPGKAETLLNSQYDKQIVAMYNQYRQKNPKEIKLGSSDEEPQKDIDISYVYRPKLRYDKKDEENIVLGTQLSGSMGSNSGGIYRGVDNKLRYVKFYPSATQASSEHLANKLYNCLGISAPESGLLNSTYYSQIIPNVKTLQEVGLNKERARNILDGFAADVLMANWDTIGLVNDNIVFEPGSDTPIRIDNGGTFLTRAQGQPKTSIPGYTEDSLLNDIPEYQSLLDPKLNQRYAAVFAASEYSDEEFQSEFKKQVKQILKLFSFHGDWNAFIREVYDNTHSNLDYSTREKLGIMLNNRTLKLAEKAGLMSDIDTVSEYKDVIKVDSEYKIAENLNARYDLLRDTPLSLTDSRNRHLVEKQKHTQLIVMNKDTHEAVFKWKEMSLWRRTIRERMDIIKKIRNILSHSSTKIEPKTLLRGMGFDSRNPGLAKLFLRNFKQGKVVRLLPSGFSLMADTANGFAYMSDPTKISIMMKVSPPAGQKLAGMHISDVPDMNNYDLHKDEQEIILSDSHGYQIDKIYRQPVVINQNYPNSTPQTKTVYVVYMTQVPTKLNEAVENMDADKLAEYVLQMCMMGSVGQPIPTEQDFRKMVKK